LCYDYSSFVILWRFSACEISGFRREVNDNCVLLPYFATSGGRFGKNIGPFFKLVVDGTDRLSRNVGK
jgi:hypothetical protein